MVEVQGHRSSRLLATLRILGSHGRHTRIKDLYTCCYISCLQYYRDAVVLAYALCFLSCILLWHACTVNTAVDATPGMIYSKDSGQVSVTGSAGIYTGTNIHEAQDNFCLHMTPSSLPLEALSDSLAFAGLRSLHSGQSRKSKNVDRRDHSRFTYNETSSDWFETTYPSLISLAYPDSVER